MSKWTNPFSWDPLSANKGRGEASARIRACLWLVDPSAVTEEDLIKGQLSQDLIQVQLSLTVGYNFTCVCGITPAPSRAFSALTLAKRADPPPSAAESTWFLVVPACPCWSWVYYPWPQGLLLSCVICSPVIYEWVAPAELGAKFTPAMNERKTILKVLPALNRKGCVCIDPIRPQSPGECWACHLSSGVWEL